MIEQRVSLPAGAAVSTWAYIGRFTIAAMQFSLGDDNPGEISYEVSNDLPGFDGLIDDCGHAITFPDMFPHASGRRIAIDPRLFLGWEYVRLRVQGVNATQDQSFTFFLVRL